MEFIIPLAALIIGQILAFFILRMMIRLLREIGDPRMRAACEAAEILKQELDMKTYPEVGIFNRDITLWYPKSTVAEIQPRLGEIRKALAEFPDTISLENEHGHAQLVLVAPPGSGKREEERRKPVVLQPSLQ